MNKWLCGLFVVFVLVCINAVYLFPIQSHYGASSHLANLVPGPPQCGHWAVINGCKLNGFGVNLEDAMAALPYNPHGHSFKQLQTAFAKYGLEATFRKLGFSDIQPGPQSMVLHLKEPNHFVVCFLKTTYGLYCFDATGKRSVFRDKDLANHWTGNVLVLARSARDVFRQGPSIQFDTLYLDKGDIPDDISEVEVKFPFTNVGDQPLAIKSVDVSCMCLKTVFKNEPVPPGAKGVIGAVFRNPQSKSFVQNITVHTNDTSHPVVLTVQAGVVPWANVFPGRLDFGNVVHGSAKTTHMKIRVQHEGVGIANVSSHSPLIKASIGARITSDNLENSELHSDLSISVTLSTDSSVKRHFQDLLVLKPDDNRLSDLKIPVSAVFVPSISYSPSTVKLKRRDAKRVFIRSEERAPISLKSIQCKNSEIVIGRESLSNNVETVATFSLSSTGQVPVEKEEIVVVTVDAQEPQGVKTTVLEIPVILEPK